MENKNVVSNEKDIAIQITGLKKRYRLGLITAGTLKGDIQSWWARKRGKEDPTLKIGAKVHSKNEVFMALDGIDLTVYKGERVGIIGHNGAGKSTLLKLLSRVTGPTEGEIKIDGRITSMLEVGTGFNGELTGRENVYLNGAILGMSKEEVDKKMDDIIEFSECRQFIDTPVKRYSSGMFVKLAFSVAAHLDSEIMIMDEVLAVGDMAFQKKCLDKMSSVSKEEGKTILYVSHNMNTIRQLCDRVVVLNRGKIIFNGDVEEGIGIYLGVKDEMNFPVEFDYSNIKRTCHFGQQIFIKKFRFINKETATYSINEKIKFDIIYDSKIEMDDVRIILRIKDKNSNVKIASVLSKTFTVRKGDNQSISLSVNLDSLIEDIYCLSFEIITTDSTGYYFSYDNPAAMIFLNLINDTENSIRWSKNFWGNVRLPDIEIKK